MRSASTPRTLLHAVCFHLSFAMGQEGSVVMPLDGGDPLQSLSTRIRA